MVSGGEPTPDRTTYCDMHKTLGLFVSLRLRQNYVLWYGKTGSGDSLPGTYKGDEPRVAATMVLNADHSFTQDIVQGGNAPSSCDGHMEPKLRWNGSVLESIPQDLRGTAPR